MRRVAATKQLFFRLHTCSRRQTTYLSHPKLLRRRNMYLEDYSCVFCASAEDETIAHLFLHCPFAQDCWNSINLLVLPSWSPFTAFEYLKQQLAVPFFMEIIILLFWSIWITRYNFIFNGIQPSTLNSWRQLLHLNLPWLSREQSKITSPALRPG